MQVKGGKMNIEERLSRCVSEILILVDERRIKVENVSSPESVRIFKDYDNRILEVIKQNGFTPEEFVREVRYRTSDPYVVMSGLFDE